MHKVKLKTTVLSLMLCINFIGIQKLYAATFTNERIVTGTKQDSIVFSLRSDSLALIEFYNAMNGPNWNRKKYWLQTNPLHTWAGIEVQNGRVTRVILPDNNLRGIIPESFNTLDALEFVDFSCNELDFNSLDPLTNYSGFTGFPYEFIYAPQCLTDSIQIIGKSVFIRDEIFQLEIENGEQAVHTWYKDGNAISTDGGQVLSNPLELVSPEQQGQYQVVSSHPDFLDLTFTSAMHEVYIWGFDSLGYPTAPGEIIIDFMDNLSDAALDSLISDLELTGFSLLETCNCPERWERWGLDLEDRKPINLQHIIDRASEQTSSVEGVSHNGAFVYEQEVVDSCLSFEEILFRFDPRPNSDTADPIRIAIPDAGFLDTLDLSDYLAFVDSSMVIDACWMPSDGLSFIADELAVDPDNHMHGIHMLSYILSNLAPNVKIEILNLKIADKHKRGTVFDAACAIYYAIENHADIINASWMHYGESSYFLEKAFEAASDNGIIVVTAAGNGINGIGQDIANDATACYPAAYNFDLLLTVGTYSDSLLAVFSNYSSDLVDFVAPGWQIRPWQNAVPANGTSYSTAYMTAMIASFMHAYPNTSAQDIIHKLRLVATPFDHTMSGKIEPLGANVTVKDLCVCSPEHIVVEPFGGISRDIIDSLITDSDLFYITEFIPVEDTCHILVTDAIGNEYRDSILCSDRGGTELCMRDTMVYPERGKCYATLTLPAPFAGDPSAIVSNTFNGDSVIIGEDFFAGRTQFYWTIEQEDGIDSCKAVVAVYQTEECGLISLCGCDDPESLNYDPYRYMGGGDCTPTGSGVTFNSYNAGGQRLAETRVAEEEKEQVEKDNNTLLAKGQKAKLYPNPTSGIIRFSDAKNIKNIRVYNLQGICRYEKLKLYSDRVNIGHLSRGVYIVQWFDGDVGWSEKVLLE